MNILVAFIKSGRISLSGDQELRISRRGLIAGLIASPAMLYCGSIAASQSTPITPINLGFGLEIRDYRLFPTKDAMRFIVEIHNTTDLAVDTPSVGIELRDLGNSESFGWATPVAPVLHPNSSECLFGIAPSNILSDDHWGTPRWTLCNGIENLRSQELATWEIEFTESLEIIDTGHARAHFAVKNYGSNRATGGVILGTVRDENDRVCGLLLPSSIHDVLPLEGDHQVVNVVPSQEYTSNPFALIDNVNGIRITSTLQPRFHSINPGCPSVLPWNR